MEQYLRLIDKWITQIGDRSIVIVVGSGFSLNAESSKRLKSRKIPLWDDIISEIQKETGDISGDNLLSFDIYNEYFGRAKYEQIILDAMPDDSLIPGEAHNCLARMPHIRAIITTNNIDTLLDKTFPHANRIVKDIDIPKLKEDKMDLIYLHGHRTKPESWVFSRTDYDEFEERFPLKSSLCRVLLSTYPSLFLGFGYSDQDLHSIMRYVINTVKEYRPPMLALSTSKKNDILKEYWKKLGLSVSVIHDSWLSSSDKTKAVVDVLEYINKHRISNLIKAGKLSPGFRNIDSYMDELVKESFDCKARDGNLVLCDYHESRKRAVIYRNLSEADIVPYSAYTSYLKPGGKVLSLIDQMNNGFIPSGSWGLMPSHRKWLFNAINGVKAEEDRIRILIVGIAGLPHFVDTVSLIMDSLDGTSLLEITVIDICQGPLKMINDFLKNEYIESDREDSWYYQEVHSYYKDKKISVRCVNSDVFEDDMIESNFYDIVLSHHFLSFYNEESDSRIKAYCAFITKSIKKNGLLVSAQNIIPSENHILALQNLFSDEGLEPVNMESSFDVYDFNKGTLTNSSDGKFVDNETILLVHRKGT